MGFKWGSFGPYSVKAYDDRSTSLDVVYDCYLVLNNPCRTHSIDYIKASDDSGVDDNMVNW